MMSLLLEEGLDMSEKDRVVSHKHQCSHCKWGAIVHVCANVPELIFTVYELYQS